MPDIQEYSVSIKFKTEGVDKAVSDTAKVKKSVDTLASFSKGFSVLKTGLGAISQGVGTLTSGLKKVVVAGGAALVKFGKDAAKYEKQTADYIETLNLFRTSMGSLARDAEEFRDRAESSLGLDPSVTMDAISSFQNLSEGFGIASDRAYIMSKNLTQLSGDLSSFANISYDAAQKKLMSGFSGQVMPLRKYGIALDQASLQELAYSLGIEKKVKTMTRAQKSELIYYQIMKSTQKMQGDLGRTLMSPANALRVLQTEFAQLARAVGSIFIPIFQRIIPIMRAVTKALTEAAKAIAAFFGYDIENYTVSFSEVDSSFDGIADGIDDVGDSAEGTAKKLNKMLMPFDELNNITSSQGSGSGSGSGAGVGGGSLGIELPQYDMFANIDDRIAKFEDIIETAKRTAAKINDLLEGINWDKIKSDAGDIGKNIAEFLNVGITDINWNLIGSTIGEGLNTAINFAHEFVNTFDFKTLGEDISSTINGFFETVEWDKMGETVSTGIEGLLDTAITFIDNLNADAITDAIEKFINNIDFKGIIARLVTFLNKLLFKALEVLVNLFIDKVNEINEQLPPALRGAFYSAFGPLEHIEIKDSGLVSGALFADVEYETRNTNKAMENLANNATKGFEKISKNLDTTSKKVGNLGSTTERTTNNVMTNVWSTIATKYQQASEAANTSTESIASSAESNGSKTERTTNTFMSNVWSTITSKYQQASDAANTATTSIKSNAESNGSATERTTNSFMTNVWSTIATKYQQASDAANIATASIKSNAESNGNATQRSTNTFMSSIANSIITGYEQAKQSANDSTSNIKTSTETNFGNLAKSNAFSKISEKILETFNKGANAQGWGSETSSGYAYGLNSQTNNGNSIFNVAMNKARSAIESKLNMGSSAYTWGQDIAIGMQKGIEAKKEAAIKAVREMAKGISSLIHFSRPDEGPLRDYETYMPDMVKGLSETLLKSIPILKSAVQKMASSIGENLMDINMPEINQSIFADNNNSSIIGNISSKVMNTKTDEPTMNIMRATYDAMSRALSENTSNNKSSLIQIQLGNRELYKGYGQYKDEESNMLGISI